MALSDVARRVPFAAACLVGLFLVVAPLTTGQLEAARAGDELVDGAAPFLTDDGLDQVRTDFERIDGTLTRMAADPGFRSRVEGDAELSAAAARLPEVEATADKVITNLEDRQDEFESAASLPVSGVDLTWGMFGAFAAAGIALLAGGAGAVRPTRTAAVALLLVGLAMAALPVALGGFGKARNTEALLDSLRPFSIEKVRGREQGLADVRLVFEAYDGTAVPPDDLAATEASLDRFGELVDFSRFAQPRLVEATAVPATSTIRAAVASGTTLVVLGAIGFVVARRPRRTA